MGNSDSVRELDCDWFLETDASLTDRLDAAKLAQDRSRFASAAMVVANTMLMILLFNSYLGYDYRYALQLADNAQATAEGLLDQKTATGILNAQALKGWADARYVSVNLLGLKVGVDDVSTIGAIALCSLSLWLLIALRRENHTIGQLLRQTDAPARGEWDEDQVARRRWRILVTLLSRSFFYAPMYPQTSTKDGPIDDNFGVLNRLDDDPQITTSAKVLSRINRLRVWLPLATMVLAFGCDVASFLLPDPFNNGKRPEFEPMDHVPFFVAIALAAAIYRLCQMNRQYEDGTMAMLRNYQSLVAADIQGSRQRAAEAAARVAAKADPA